MLIVMALQRSSNFSSFEKNLLTELMEQYGQIIEDKKTNKQQQKKKQITALWKRKALLEATEGSVAAEKNKMLTNDSFTLDATFLS